METIIGWMVVTFLVLTMVGCILAGYWHDRFGDL